MTIILSRAHNRCTSECARVPRRVLYGCVVGLGFNSFWRYGMLGGRVGWGGGGGAAAGRVAVRLVSKGQGAERFATYILHAMISPIN